MWVGHDTGLQWTDGTACVIGQSKVWLWDYATARNTWYDTMLCGIVWPMRIPIVMHMPLRVPSTTLTTGTLCKETLKQSPFFYNPITIYKYCTCQIFICVEKTREHVSVYWQQGKSQLFFIFIYLYSTFFCKGKHTKCQPCTTNSTHFVLLKIFLRYIR